MLINQLDNIYRLFVSIFDYFRNRRRISLLYDYSLANKGYSREVHRDSDSRLVVFLLYLNELESNSGGNLEIFESKRNHGAFSPNPDIKSLNKIKEISPSPGKLVLFLNTSNAYHAVSLMNKSKSETFSLWWLYFKYFIIFIITYWFFQKIKY